MSGFGVGERYRFCTGLQIGASNQSFHLLPAHGKGFQRRKLSLPMCSVKNCGGNSKLKLNIQVIATQEANKRNNNWLPPWALAARLSPLWALAAMAILGFNEFMMLLSFFSTCRSMKLE